MLHFKTSDNIVIVDAAGGVSGSGAPAYTGGPPGTPTPARVRRTVKQYTTTGAISFPPTVTNSTLHTYTAVKGQDAAATVAASPKGPDGEIISDDTSTNLWLSPLAMRQALSWIRTAYLNNHLDAAAASCREWLGYLETFRASPVYAESPADWARDFRSIEEQLELCRHRLANGLDYFGNPPGWTPLLSLEVNQAAFRQEIDTAINILYLNYWLGNIASDLTQRIQGYAAARAALQQEITQLRTSYNEAVARIPDLQSEAANVQVDVDYNKEQLRVLEANLLARAEAKARGPWWKQAAKSLALICDVLPVP